MTTLLLCHHLIVRLLVEVKTKWNVLHLFAGTLRLTEFRLDDLDGGHERVTLVLYLGLLNVCLLELVVQFLHGSVLARHGSQQAVITWQDVLE